MLSWDRVNFRRVWNESFIRRNFTKDDAEVVLGIIPGSFTREDRLIWHYNKDREYTVKSGYSLRRELQI